MKGLKEIIRKILKEQSGLELGEAKNKKKKVKRDACYHKVKSRYKVWPSAYGSGALVKCRKVGAKNWGNSTKEETLVEKRKLTKKPSSESSLKDWFGRKGAKGSTGGWVDCNTPDGKGGYKSCGRKEGEKRTNYPACRPTPAGCNSKGKGKKWGKKSKNEAVNYHLDKKIPLNECIFRHGSKGHLKFINDVRDFVNESELYVNHDERELLRTDLGSYGVYEGEQVPLDLPMINEAEYRGKKVTLNKPKRGGSKAYYVYVKDPKTGNVKKVSFGSSGLRAKINNIGAVKSFVARHRCKEKNDKTKAGYWSCRLPRYAKSLGLSGGGQWW
jgi:hypothetical protein